jgi:phage baseplate assembly protein W
MSRRDDEGRLVGRGVGFPPRIGPDGRVAWSSGADGVREAIRVILLTAPGERLMLPAFGAGLRTFLFEPNVPATHQLIQERVVQAIARWEPRVTLTAVEVDADADDALRANVTIDYSLVATGEAARVDLAIPMAAA